MPLTELFGLDSDGKLIAGWTEVRTPWGEWRTVVKVTSGRMPTPIDPTVRSGQGTAERCALYGERRER